MRSLVVSGLLLWFSVATPAHSADAGACLPFGPDLQASGWSELRFFGRARARFDPLGEKAIAITSDASVSVLYRDIEEDALGRPFLRWHWQVTQTVPATDLTKRGADDRSLALHLVFAPKDARKRGFFRPQPRGDVLSYVWGGDGPIGEPLVNPYHDGHGYQIILQTGGTTGEAFEQINYVRDYHRAFGSAPPPLYMIGVSADSDDTDTNTEGSLTDVCFARHKLAP